MNDPYLGMSDPRTKIPQTAGPAETGRQYHPLADKDYYTYGQTGGEHQFFTGNLPVAPLQPNNLPGGGGGSSGGGGGAAGVLGDLTQIAGAAKNAGQLANMAGIDNTYTDAMKNPIGAAKDAYGNYQLNNSNVGSGQYANNALSDAGYGSNWVTPALSGLGAAGAASTGLGGGTIATITPELIGEGVGAATAGTGAAGAAETGIGAGAAGSGAAGASGAGGASTLGALAAPAAIAAIGWAAADAFNKSGDIKSASTSQLLKNMTSSQGWKLVDPRTQTYQLPDGRFIRADENARAVSEAVRKGDQAGAEKAYEEWLASAKSPGGHSRGGSMETGTPGILAYASDPKFNGSVKGKGTGRSDEIPARLSDGEYVMDAETVAMLGDGSTDAGAKKLDEMRARLRSHKGKKLARGKFSDNAKDPMEYIK